MVGAKRPKYLLKKSSYPTCVLQAAIISIFSIVTACSNTETKTVSKAEPSEQEPYEDQ
jgi:hypothetical protein